MLKVEHCYVLVLLLNSIDWIIKHTSGRGGNFGSSGKGTTISYYGGELLFGVPGGVGGVQLTCCCDTSSEQENNLSYLSISQCPIFLNIVQGEESGTNGGNGYSGGGCGGTGGQPGDQLLPILSRWRSKPPTRWSRWAGWWGWRAFAFLWRWWSRQWGGLSPISLDDVLVGPISYDLLLSRWTSRSSP